MAHDPCTDPAAVAQHDSIPEAPSDPAAAAGSATQAQVEGNAVSEAMDEAIATEAAADVPGAVVQEEVVSEAVVPDPAVFEPVVAEPVVAEPTLSETTVPGQHAPEPVVAPDQLAAKNPAVEVVKQDVQQTQNSELANTSGGTALSPPPEPSIASTVRVEPIAASGQPALQAPTGEGGEWELLLEKLRQWLSQNDLQNLWSQASKPFTALAALVGLLLVLRIYSAVLSAIDDLPLVPGLLELAGVVWLVRYGVPRLLRSSEREHLISGIRHRWLAFRGKAG